MADLFELERNLSRKRRKPKGRKAAARPAPATGTSEKPRRRPERTAAARAQRASAVRSRRGPRALELAVDVTVVPVVTALRRPGERTGWAAGVTMLKAWPGTGESAPTSIESVVGGLGERFVERLQAGAALSRSEFRDLIATAGLVAEEEGRPDIVRLAEMLRQFGPLWVVPAKIESYGTTSRVLVGARGAGEPAATTFTAIDPSTGQSMDQPAATFWKQLSGEFKKQGGKGVLVLHRRREDRPSQGDAGSARPPAPRRPAPMPIESPPPAERMPIESPPPAERMPIESPPPAQEMPAKTPAPAVPHAGGTTPSAQAFGMGPEELARKVAQDEGQDEAAVREFFARFGPPGGSAEAQSWVGAMGTTVHLPGGTVLSGTEARLFKRGLGLLFSASPLGLLGNFIPDAILAACSRLNVTVGIGPTIQGGLGAGGNLGVGILFAPGDRIGFYGSGTGLGGFIYSIGAGVQVTVVRGGPENFKGQAVTGSVSFSVAGINVGATGLYSPGSSKLIGVSYEVGIELAAAIVGSIEAAAGLQGTSTSLSAPFGVSEAMFKTMGHVNVTQDGARAAGVDASVTLLAGANWSDIPLEGSVRIVGIPVPTNVVDLIRTARTAYRSHLGQNQFWHSMAPSSSYTNGQVLDQILRQAREWYDAGDDFQVGKLLHMVQDSYSPAHVWRDGSGKVKGFQNYALQDGDKHGDADANPGGTAFQDAAAATTRILSLRKNRRPASELESFLRSTVYAWADPSVPGASVPGTVPAYAKALQAELPAPKTVQLVQASGMVSLARSADEVDLKLRLFIPSPAVGVGPGPFFGGDGRSFNYSGGTHRAQIHATVGLSGPHRPPGLTVIDRSWGASTRYDSDDVTSVAGKPSWWRALREGARPVERDMLQATPSNLKAEVGPAANTARTITRVELDVEGALPLMPSPDIDAELRLLLNPGRGGLFYKLDGKHDGFPAYELYLNGTRIWEFDPVAQGQTPLSLLPPMEFTAKRPWTEATGAVAAVMAG